MILLFIFSIELTTKIDSLNKLLDEQPELPIILQLNKCYLQQNEFYKSINLLKKFETKFLPEKPILMFNIGDTYLFAGDIPSAREQYLKLVSRYPRSDVANDALERLYLIEATRQDTLRLKKLAYAVCLFRTDQLDNAIDSLKGLLKTKVGAYAHYYSALIYKQKEDLPLALGALEELNNFFPGHKIHNAALLLADIHIQSDNKKAAQKILENLIVKNPNTIYAVRAREMLKTLGSGLDF
jgi:tetratricopeptide (TPR) repeat protein